MRTLPTGFISPCRDKPHPANGKTMISTCFRMAKLSAASSRDNTIDCRNYDRCSSRRGRSGAEPPGWRSAGSPHTPAGGTHELRSRRSAIRPGVDTHGGGFGGGGPGVDTHKGRGVRYSHLLPWPRAETAPRRPVPERSSSTLARQTTVASSHPALTSRNFPSFGAETGSVTSLAFKAAVLEKSAPPRATATAHSRC
jgi:hypothetical protein